MKMIAAILLCAVALLAFGIMSLDQVLGFDLTGWGDTPSASGMAVWNGGLAIPAAFAAVWLIARRRRTSTARGARSSLVARARS